MRVLSMIFGLALAGMAQAQSEDPGKWQVLRGEADDPGVGAGMCPLYDEATRRGFCLALSCDEGGEMEFMLSVLGFPLAPTMTAAVEVDGHDAGTLVFDTTQTPGGFEFIAAFDPKLHPALVEKLKRGAKATFVLSGDTELFRQEMPLVNSSKTLNVILTECKMPTGG